MKKQNKPRIILSLSRENDKIIKLSIKDIVKKLSRSGYVALPKELIGKYVNINLEVLK